MAGRYNDRQWIVAAVGERETRRARLCHRVNLRSRQILDRIAVLNLVLVQGADDKSRPRMASDPPPRVGTERQDIELATVSQELFGKASAEWAVESSLLAYLDVLCFGRHGNETQMQYFVPPVSGRPRFSRATLEVQHDEQPAGLPPVLLR